MGEAVKLYMYDMAKSAGMFLGVGRIWHTSIVVFGYELSFNVSEGVQIAENPGNPTRIIELGETTTTWKQLEMYVNLLASEAFHRSNYDVMVRNCNNFSNDLAIFLCGEPLPYDILHMPTRIAGTSVVMGTAAATLCSIV